ncbi:hypothetical protein Lalb_Chr10g0094071 [Lupinus albus]|uniref:Uncharacterized protein n=1 Tax=Lupinus albus TaxID=3870 RepID=A0A6A4PU14_LUPAL|nr:hypothetical protein Lalb_Chr10g0094071 [Lupinus albus]
MSSFLLFNYFIFINVLSNLSCVNCSYLLIALLHIPCYGIFWLIVEMKHYFLSKWFPSSYQC